MKNRQGFVSNSSSSSFVIGKNFMTDEQISKFSDLVNGFNTNDGDTYIFEDEKYFFGEVDDRNDIEIENFIHEEGLDTCCGWDCQQ